MFKILLFRSLKPLKPLNVRFYASPGCIHITDHMMTPEIKLEIERHWTPLLPPANFDSSSGAPKRYVLAMFPYPSGFLHMGHVRVYAISDAMARFYRMNGYNVLHPMGWDAFGLPAENAAIQHQIPADRWTRQNIEHMRKQLNQLGCGFDWSREFATCDPEYYRWTQKLFLMLFKDGLAYQKEAMVNWDPVDETVLADEQVDEQGCSWRSGAKVERRLLRQWFVRTTIFSKELVEGLDDPILEDWRDVAKIQKNWVGECSGFRFDLRLENDERSISVWTERPECLKFADFIAIKRENIFNEGRLKEGRLKLTALNPFSGKQLPIVVSEDLEYPDNCDTYLGCPAIDERDQEVAEKFKIPFSPVEGENFEKLRAEVLAKAKEIKIGGFPVSSKIRDWLISRQRFWGTPIPIIHCEKCGPVPVPDDQLPVTLPADVVAKPLSQNQAWLNTTCPCEQKCKARRESDTMDTFVDSSWYFLRYLDPKNDSAMFDERISRQMMPVDLYVGGKEHAELHLYYARFIGHYLHKKGLIPHPEPFKRLLVQGMVMGQAFRLKESGRYLPPAQVEIVDEEKGEAKERTTGAEVLMSWEKMSKSKFNGVDPDEVIRQMGCDTLRMIILADVAPTSHRNWSEKTFPGILNWQHRLWLTVNDFKQFREEMEPAPSSQSEDFRKQEEEMWDSRNFYTAAVTFNFMFSHQLSVGISKMQGLTNALRRASKDVMIHGKEFEHALAAQIIMIAPLAPHLASELWSRVANAPNRLNPHINWNADVLDQPWPVVDQNFKLQISVRVNGEECSTVKAPRCKFDLMTKEEALELAVNDANVITWTKGRINRSDFVLYPGCQAFLYLNSPVQIDKKKMKKMKKQAKKAAA